MWGPILSWSWGKTSGRAICSWSSLVIKGPKVTVCPKSYLGSVIKVYSPSEQPGVREPPEAGSWAGKYGGMISLLRQTHHLLGRVFRMEKFQQTLGKGQEAVTKAIWSPQPNMPWACGCCLYLFSCSGLESFLFPLLKLKLPKCPTNWRRSNRISVGQEKDTTSCC